jgi:hypothetical protein
MDARIRTSAGIHPMNPEECDVYTSLIESCHSGIITPCVNHTMADVGDIEGFRFTCNTRESSKCLPVNRRMFFRTSMVECTTDNDRMLSECNNVALGMLLDQENVRAKLGEVVQGACF